MPIHTVINDPPAKALPKADGQGPPEGKLNDADGFSDMGLPPQIVQSLDPCLDRGGIGSVVVDI
jgi:hypothetical protein